MFWKGSFGGDGKEEPVFSLRGAGGWGNRDGDTASALLSVSKVAWGLESGWRGVFSGLESASDSDGVGPGACGSSNRGS